MLMGITEYAAHRSCDVNAVQFAIARGRITLTESNRIDSEIADRDWEATSAQHGTARGKAVSSSKERKFATEAEPGIPYVDARALREVIEVKRKEFDLEVKRQKYVLKEDVEREAFRLFRRLRDAAFNIPPRVAAQLAAEPDEHKVFEALEKELRQVFSDFAEGRLT